MRCFLGIPLPADCRLALRNAWSVPIQERESLRLTEPGLWHTTLAFFGEVEYDNLIRLVEMIGRSLEDPPACAWSLSAVQTFPNKRPSMYVVKCKPEKEEAWRACVSQLVDMASLIAPNVDRKPWIPHITLARTKRGALLPPFEIPVYDIGWVPDHATLFISEHTQTGPRYTPLHEYRLNI